MDADDTAMTVEDSPLTQQEINEQLLNHIVLPRFLPQSQITDYPKAELVLVSDFVESVIHKNEKFIPGSTICMLRALLRINSNCTPNVVAHNIRRLKAGDTFAMYVRNQNCAIIIHVPFNEPNPVDSVIVAVFPGNLSHHEIYGNGSDVEFNYPTDAIKVKFSKILRSTEFADQLCQLSAQEFPDEPKKKYQYVREWLVNVLIDENSCTATDDEFLGIKKKIRDEIIGTADKHFRRSSFYMVVKVFLQLSLTQEFLENKGTFIYKIAMLRFLIEQCDYFNGPFCDTLNIELVTQTIAKIARRIEKLKVLKLDEPDDELEKLKDDTIFEATELIEAIRSKINAQIEVLQDCAARAAVVPTLIDVDFLADIFQKVPKLRKYIEQRSTAEAASGRTSVLNVRTYDRSYMNQNVHLSIDEKNSPDEMSNNFALSDFENSILYATKLTETRYSPEDFRQWHSNYISRASVMYAGDWLAVSKSILVSLKIVAILDQMATDAHPLLVEHHSGIKTDVFDILLLPQSIDMEIALELEEFFNARNSRSIDPSLIADSTVKADSFAVKYVDENPDMKRILKMIIEMSEKKVEEKRKEWMLGREESDKIRSRAQAFSHEYRDERHARNCKRCKLERDASNFTISAYERPLPDDKKEQKAVIFELQIPVEVACLRDSLQTFVKYCNMEKLQSLKIKGNWCEYSQIVPYCQPKGNSVSLGSTKACMKEFKPVKVSNFFASFNVANGFNCVYVESNGNLLNPLASTMQLESLRERCTMTLKNEYTCLQWTMNATHTQNDVLTRQSDCPKNLRLQEFKEFGSLRADGHRLQWRKLYAMIACDALSFECESVLSLVMQTIWQTGKSGDAGQIRESHDEIQNTKFAREMIRLLSLYIEKQQNNWVHPLKLLMATLIAIRVFELNEDETLADQIADLLDQIRTVALDWIQKIQQAIKDLHNPDPSTELPNPNPQTECQLREKLIYVTVSGALTFCIHSRHQYFDKIFLMNKKAVLNLHFFFSL